MHPFGPKILKFSRPPPTPTSTCHYVARNGGIAAMLVPLTLEKFPVITNLNKNPADIIDEKRLSFTYNVSSHPSSKQEPL